jgi:hypothetical protein
MMSSIRLSAPVITFLSPSSSASAAASAKLTQWSILRESSEPEIRKIWGVSWEFRALDCPETGSRIEYMAPTRSSSPVGGHHTLLAIQDGPHDNKVARDKLMESLSRTKRIVKILGYNLVARPVTPQALLGPSLRPVVSVSSTADLCSEPAKVQAIDGVLKEVALPFFDAGSSILDQLSVLPRIVTGLYRLDNGLALRPLPTSKADNSLPPASLVFHTVEPKDLSVDSQTIAAKIGFSGNQSSKGQTMLRHADTRGLDVRLCSSLKPTSMFCEAQESLLASSLAELQSDSVLRSTGEVDPRTLKADCWVEFRANMTRPSGFIKSNQPRIAKAPDLPYE